MYLLTHGCTLLYLVAPVTLAHWLLLYLEHLAYCRPSGALCRPAARQPKPPVAINPSPGASAPPQNRAGHCKCCCCCEPNVSKLYNIVCNIPYHIHSTLPYDICLQEKSCLIISWLHTEEATMGQMKFKGVPQTFSMQPPHFDSS